MAAWENMWATKFAPSVNEPCCWFKCGNTERRIQIVPCLKLHVLPQSGQTSCRQFLSHNIDWLILSLIKYLTTWINTTSPLFVHSDLCAVYHVMANALPWIDRVATTEWKGGGGSWRIAQVLLVVLGSDWRCSSIEDQGSSFFPHIWLHILPAGYNHDNMESTMYLTCMTNLSSKA